MRAKALYDGYTIKLPNVAGEMEDIGDLDLPNSVARLIAVKAFIYDEGSGRVSVRLERKGRGSEEGYWVAYKRTGGKLRKTYICEAYALHPWTLDIAAKRLRLTGRGLYQAL
jgi:hypothetical protein